MKSGERRGSESEAKRGTVRERGWGVGVGLRDECDEERSNENKRTRTMENVTPQLNLKRLPMDVSGDPACQAYLTRGEVLLPPQNAGGTRPAPTLAPPAVQWLQYPPKASPHRSPHNPCQVSG